MLKALDVISQVIFSIGRKLCHYVLTHRTETSSGASVSFSYLYFEIRKNKVFKNLRIQDSSLSEALFISVASLYGSGLQFGQRSGSGAQYW